MTMSTDLNEYATDQTKDGSRRLDQAKARLKDSAGAVQARMGNIAEEARSYAGRAADQIGALSRNALETARERPAASAIVVFGVGIAVGAVLALTLREPASNALDGASRLRRKLIA